MKHSTREMNREELEEFLNMTPHQIYDEVSRFKPGVIQKMVLLTILNVLLLCLIIRPIIDHMIAGTEFTWWLWAALIFMFLSFGWIHNAFPSPETARRLCEEQEIMLASRNRRG